MVSIWVCPYGPIWAHMDPYGPMWAHMEPLTETVSAYQVCIVHLARKPKRPRGKSSPFKKITAADCVPSLGSLRPLTNIETSNKPASGRVFRTAGVALCICW